MYKDYYEKISAAADKIRAGKHTRKPEVELPTAGFVQKPQAQTQEQQAPKKDSLTKKVAEYLIFLRDTNIDSSAFDMEELPNPSAGLSGLKGTDPSVMGRVKASISKTESGGNYQAKGPVTKSGDRAYGKYQVMGNNIPSWTKEALGRSYSVEEFLADTDAQEKVFETKMTQAYNKYGTWEDAASVWFSGRPLSKAKNSSDGYLTTQQYVDKFSNNLKNTKEG